MPKNRKQEILRKHPDLKKFMGIDPTTKFKVAFWVAFQLMSLHLLQGAPWYTWLFCCYTLSGSINHMMTLAMHELSHNLGAGGVTSNRLLAIFANLPMGIPAAASFKRYHMGAFLLFFSPLVPVSFGFPEPPPSTPWPCPNFFAIFVFVLPPPPPPLFQNITSSRART